MKKIIKILFVLLLIGIMLISIFFIFKDKKEEYEQASAQKIIIKKQATLEKEEIRNCLMKKGYRENTIKEVLI